ncbi:hypothetical protein [Streptomyces sp. MUM 178J]|uniref:hypothetical protein n=1 Tax=Streptomyces sp. MUM 178J TaxID=2791991 RepID=UPI0023D94C5D|nr:hypothetical protein [Streptomyces sp. MUM 178J]WRQ81095.1 hypothetical protein I3F59_018045 [Streptomyces sp. MUM 178J]
MTAVGYSERWQELFDTAGEARMTLASSTTSTSQGDTLRHSGGPWTSASGTAGALRTSTETSRKALRPGHEGIASGTVGLTAVAALNSVLESWEDRLVAVRNECDYLEGALLKVAKEMGETETAVKQSFEAVKPATHARRGE